MSETQDGFKIAEEDLKIRGPGEFMGTRQHGLPGLKIADVLRDAEWLTKSRKAAFDLIEQDPQLSDPAHAQIRIALSHHYADVAIWLEVA
jgi:ATP-dependent DNA helicase RecG